MIPTFTIRPQPLSPALLKELAVQQGPCTTFLVPGATGAREGGSRAATLRGMLHSKPANLLGSQVLQPVEDFAADFQDEAGGPGLALFRSPNYFAAAVVPGLEASAVLRGNHFLVAPLVAAVLAPQEFYVLALHRKNLHLFHYAHGVCELVALPPDVPADMETALAFDAPDHLLEGRSGSSRGVGAGHAVQFGTSSDRESDGEYLHHYFLMVDRGLKGLTGHLPLLLAGVHEDVAAFRRISARVNILESEIGGNIDFLSPSEIAILASEAAMRHYHLCGELVLRACREMRHRERALSHTIAILEAARAGRIHQLCAADDFDTNNSSGDDPVNEAILETLNHGGEVFMLPPGAMTAEHPLAAILRY